MNPIVKPKPGDDLTPPIVLTVAGSDSGGGAGIQADLKTFSALGVYGCSAITSLTAQNTCGVQDVYPIASSFVREQMLSVLSDMPVAVIKTGMLANADIIRALSEVLAHCYPVPIVVDPVMISTSGDSLLEREAVEVLLAELLPRATLITPNLHEAAALLGEKPARNLAARWDQAERLLALGAEAVLLKGGHDTGPEIIDVLATSAGLEHFTSARIQTHNTHGTGCTLASAIAAGLALGRPLPIAVAEAKEYLQGALVAGARRKLGMGSGPPEHFYRHC